MLPGNADFAWEQEKLEARKMPENAQTPTSRMHAVLGGFNCYEVLLLDCNHSRKTFAIKSCASLSDMGFEGGTSLLLA